MISKNHLYEYYTCFMCEWEGEGVELTDGGECPKCYALLEEDLDQNKNND